MDYKKILQGILDIGEAMIQCGAEMSRVEDSMYRMCGAYGFVRYDVWAIVSNIQITVETKEGDIFTQIRHIKPASTDFDKLDYLNNLSRYICSNTPDADAMHEKYLEVMNRPEQKLYLHYIAGILGGAGFAVFFGSNFADAAVALSASFLIVHVGRWLSKKESNLVVYNLVSAFLAEIWIIAAVRMGIGSHVDRITVGIVMLLISGLGTTNGIRDLLQSDILSGIYNIINSILGAVGIACGIALALILLRGVENDMFILNPNIPLQLISCTAACVGFALWFKIKGKQVVYSGVGAFFTWMIYLIVHNYSNSNFVATMFGAMFVYAFAVVMARVNKAPATIFLTASAFPLIPGPNLYYMMYAFVNEDFTTAGEQGLVLFVTCVGIAFGFMAVDILNRYVTVLQNYFHAKKMGKGTGRTVRTPRGQA